MMRTRDVHGCSAPAWWGCAEIGDLSLCSSTPRDAAAPKLGAGGLSYPSEGQLEGGKVPGRQEPAPSAGILLELLAAESQAPSIRPTQGALVCREEMIHVHRVAPQQIFHS